MVFVRNYWFFILFLWNFREYLPEIIKYLSLKINYGKEILNYHQEILYFNAVEKTGWNGVFSIYRATIQTSAGANPSAEAVS